ncbi:hypothetical protein ACFO4O_11450 [Glaciecola siphonariae]|uniref:Uncharacterized protein n=1 Tax=Glaciecola siphonariae TaxID=521012 RepID=A0ABV9LW66_9ALTE
MEPDYKTYSIEELEDSLRSIDQAAYPDRTKRIKDELEFRRSKSDQNNAPLTEYFEPNEQFYKCPTCGEKIGFFSRSLNKWGKIKKCPHCGAPYRVTIKLKVYAVALIPLLIIHMFIMSPLMESFGLSNGVGVGILCGFMVYFSMRLSKVRSGSVT